MRATALDKAFIGGGILLMLVGVVGYATSGGETVTTAPDPAAAEIDDTESDDEPDEAASDGDDAGDSGDEADGDDAGSMEQVDPPTVVIGGEDSTDTDTVTTEEVSAEEPDEPATPPEESVEDFLALLTETVRSDDRSFAVERLGAATIGRYGTEQCEAYVAGLDDATFDVTVREVGEPETWDYTTDGQTTTLADAIPVEVERIARGETVIQELHLTRADDGTLRWYSDCGDPR